MAIGICVWRQISDLRLSFLFYTTPNALWRLSFTCDVHVVVLSSKSMLFQEQSTVIVTGTKERADSHVTELSLCFRSEVLSL